MELFASSGIEVLELDEGNRARSNAKRIRSIDDHGIQSRDAVLAVQPQFLSIEKHQSALDIAVFGCEMELLPLALILVIHGQRTRPDLTFVRFGAAINLNLERDRVREVDQQ